MNINKRRINAHCKKSEVRKQEIIYKYRKYKFIDWRFLEDSFMVNEYRCLPVPIKFLRKQGKGKFTHKGQQAVLFSSELKGEPVRGSKYCHNKKYQVF